MTSRTRVVAGAAALAGLTALVVAGLAAIRWSRNGETHRADIGPDTVVMLGDSLTEMGDWDDLLPDHTVSNHGYSGYTSAEIQPIAADVAADQPAIVFIMTGTNDIRDGHPPSWTERELGLILDHFERSSPGTEIIIQSVLPRIDAVQEVEALNEVIASFAEDRGATYLDLHPTFDRGDGGLRIKETTDGIHLSEAGYARWGDRLETFLANDRR